jgi:hypothetical protein
MKESLFFKLTEIDLKQALEKVHDDWLAYREDIAVERGERRTSALRVVV